MSRNFIIIGHYILDWPIKNQRTKYDVINSHNNIIGLLRLNRVKKWPLDVSLYLRTHVYNAKFVDVYFEEIWTLDVKLLPDIQSYELKKSNRPISDFHKTACRKDWCGCQCSAWYRHWNFIELLSVSTNQHKEVKTLTSLCWFVLTDNNS